MEIGTRQHVFLPVLNNMLHRRGGAQLIPLNYTFYNLAAIGFILAPSGFRFLMLTKTLIIGF
jgi:hypothetical protein